MNDASANEEDHIIRNIHNVNQAQYTEHPLLVSKAINVALYCFIGTYTVYWHIGKSNQNDQNADDIEPQPIKSTSNVLERGMQNQADKQKVNFLLHQKYNC